MKNTHNTISRRAFINRATMGAAAVAITPVASLLANPAASSFSQSASGQIELPTSGEGMQLLKEMTALNDGFLAPMIQNAGRLSATGNAGSSGGLIMVFAAAYVNPVSKYYHDNSLPPLMEKSAEGLAARQNPSGLYDSGNLDSPPDTGFMIDTLCKAQNLLLHDNTQATANVRDIIGKIIRKSAKGILTGGVHTPNHRWHVCSSLAHINSLYPDEAYIKRIDDWLDEGLDIDEDGQWGERSSNYNSAVNNPAMMNLALLLKRDELLEPLRRNLEMTLYYVEPDGSMETVASRRQDQRRGSRKYVHEYYSQYRLLAVLDNNGVFANMARYIEKNFMSELARSTNRNSPLVYLLEESLFGAKLPENKPLPDNYEKVFANSKVVRYRRGDISATINGGNDAALGYGFGSGLAMNPAFFRMTKGEVVLDSVRMTPAFFNTGFFYPNELTKVDGGYMLSETRKVPYHLPLPKEYRNADGQYKLTPDGRFYSKMDFPNRPKDFKEIVSKVTIREKDGDFTLDFDIGGYEGVPVTIELSFNKGGTLTGVTPIERGSARGGQRAVATEQQSQDEPEIFSMNESHGSYTVGNSKLEFGPGIFEHNRLNMESEQFGVHNGELRTDGLRVYMTGTTPFKHTLKII